VKEISVSVIVTGVGGALEQSATQRRRLLAYFIFTPLPPNTLQTFNRKPFLKLL
jgi:hypothetical protein